MYDNFRRTHGENNIAGVCTGWITEDNVEKSVDILNKGFPCIK
jgi:hypothetical protein